MAQRLDVIPASKNEADFQLAESFRFMQTLPAWEYVESLMAEIKESAFKKIDETEAGALTVGDVAYIKGIRDAIDRIERGVDQATSGSAL